MWDLLLDPAALPCAQLCGCARPVTQGCWLQVLLDGMDARQVPLAWLRSQVGLVSQEPVLFATTIGANIAFGRPGARQQDIEQAAQAANAHKFITSLPKG